MSAFGSDVGRFACRYDHREIARGRSHSPEWEMRLWRSNSFTTIFDLLTFPLMGGLANLSAQDRRVALEQAIGFVADGDRSALKRVYELTSSKLLGTILQIVRERDIAEDILQDVYLKVWSRAGRFDRAKASPITWLCVIARNTAIDYLRKAGRLKEVADDGIPEIEDDAPNADAMLCDAEDSERLKICLDGLQDDHRRCIRMAFFRGYTHSELSQKLEVPLGTLKSWIRRGLASLKGCLGDG